MRNLRFRSAATAATTALVAALALTACQPSDAVGSAPKPDSTVAATDEPDSKTSDKPQPPADQSADNGNGGSADNKSGGGDKSAGNDSANNGAGKGSTTAKTTTCTGDNTKVTVTEVARPINHLLVTATNTGSGNCYAYSAPLLGFDEAQAVTQINEDSRPQAVVTLTPGQSAYASIALGGGDGAPTTAAYKLSVHFAGRGNQGSVGSSANLTLPKGTMIADSASVSYWQTEMADALVW
ncbi:DUF4232 domain-containing protein [Streptomyces sp. NPDC051217]|uniref:DUF4232 domain-containing protein n=1 Tax=Streptomyces sp. NPDC051217 TaxID=3365644 RepID=UPI0037A1E5D7